VVTGAEFLGHKTLGQEVTGARGTGAESSGAGSHWAGAKFLGQGALGLKVLGQDGGHLLSSAQVRLILADSVRFGSTLILPNFTKPY
jgi:hypothetical protein